MDWNAVRTFTRWVNRSPVGPQFAAFLALLSARFPGLIPLLVSSATPSVPSSFNQRLLQVARRRAAALKTAVFAIAASAIMVAAAFAGMPVVVHQAAASPHVSANLPANDSTPFFPYLVPGSDYPAPMNLTPGGNLSLPVLTTTDEAGNPVLHLLAISSGDGSPMPLLLTGGYSEALAREIQAGSSCSPSHGHGHGPPGKGGNVSGCAPPTIALQWSLPFPLRLANGTPIVSPGPVTGDAFVTNGTGWAFALAANGTTRLWFSSNGGNTWSGQLRIPGDDPRLVQGFGYTALTTVSATTATLSLVSPTGGVQNISPPLALQDAVPVLLPPNGTSQPLPGVFGVATNHTAVFASSANDGATWNVSVVGTAPISSTSPIFNRIGSTSLAAPGGIPDQVTAVSTGNTTVVLWTANLGGRVVPVSAASPGRGADWQGPYVVGSPEGSARDPALLLTPAGYVLAVWRSTAGNGELTEEPLGLDGRALTGAQTVSLPGEVAPGAEVAVTVDPLERPFFAWTSYNTSVLQVTGALLHAPQAVSEWLQAVENLTAADLANGTNASQSALENKLTALLHQVNGPTVPTGAIEMIEQDLYPKVTNLPLLLGCTGPVPVCGHLHRGNNPPWIVNQTGVDAPNAYLAVYAEWALEALGVMTQNPPTSDSTFSGYEYLKECSPSNVCASTNVTIEMNVTVDVTDPTTAHLTFSSFLPPMNVTLSNTTVQCGNSTSVSYAPVQWFFRPVGTTYQVYLHDGTLAGSFNASGNLVTTVWLRNLPEAINTSFGVFDYIGLYNYNVTYRTTPGCEPVNNGFNLSWNLGGVPTVSTEQGVQLDHPLVTEIPCATCGGKVYLRVNGTANVASVLQANLTGENLTVPFDTSNYSHVLNVTRGEFDPGPYAISGSVDTRLGNATPAGSPALYYIPGESPQARESVSFSCQFTAVSSNLTISAIAVSNVTATTAEVSWLTNGPAGSLVVYTEVGSGYIQQAAGSGGTDHHAVVLQHLSPFAFYTLQAVSALPSSGCFGVEQVSPFASFQTPAIFPVTEQDLPYDSIAQEGGGAQLSFQIPDLIVRNSNFTGGQALYATAGEPSNLTRVPLLSLQAMRSFYDFNDTLAANLTLLQPNTSYTVHLQLNFTLNSSIPGIVCHPCTFTAESENTTFTYLKDTSGDGLADSEKTWGWAVTYTNARGVPVTESVSANDAAYATNGLVNDYLEKEFGLNPETLDTAGSHMLDTWNLTFDLGTVPNTQAVPNGFHTWNEECTNLSLPCLPGLSPGFNPFSDPPNPGAPPPPKDTPVGIDWSNLSNARTAGDNHNWSAEVLWSFSSLQYLAGLVPSGDWLRGVLGTWNHHLTLTVWGKLSWGANPLAASTPEDGLPDGARVNPVFDEELQIGVPFAIVQNLNYFTGAGYAVSFSVNGTPTSFFAPPSWNPEFQNYSSQTFYNIPGVPAISHYELTAPVNQTDQIQNVTVSLVVNNIDCAPPGQNLSNVSPCPKNVSPYRLVPAPLTPASSTSNSEINFSFAQDMLDPTESTIPHGINLSADWPATALSLNVTWVPVRQAPTYLWLPNDNSTVSTNLPPGLQRYTGEQDFVLVVANVSAPLSVPDVPTAWGGSYGLSVAPTQSSRLVNFLIPRGQFLSSVLGQAILNNSTLPASHNASTAVDQITGLTLSQLACYWQNLAVAPGGFSSPNTCTQAGMTLHGIDPGTPYAVTVTADSENCTQDLSTSTNCQAGGVPSDPTLSTSSPGNAAPALLAVITLNLSSSSNLTYLLAALLDNNTTVAGGQLGVTGHFVNITGQIPTLGLNSVVLSALANSSEPDSGVFGAPCSVCIPTLPGAATLEMLHLHPHDLFSIFGDLWNSFSGVVAAFLTHLATLVHALVGIVWNALVAAAAYFDHIREGLVRLAEVAVSAAVSVLKTVGHVLEAALQALLAFIVKEVEALFSPIVNAVTSAMTNYADTLWSDFHPMWKDSNSSTAINSGDAARFMDDLFGGPFLVAIGLFTIVTIALVVVQTLSLGADFLVTLVEGLIVSVAVTAFLAVTLSMVPAALLSAAAVDGAWALFNASQSGNLTPADRHPLTPDKGATCSAFAAVAGTFKVYATYQLGLKDIPEGIQLVKAVIFGAADFTLLTVFPIVNAALGVLGLALTIAAGLIGGGMGAALSTIALVLSFFGLIYGAYVLTTRGAQLRESNQFNGVLLGELISGAGTTVSLGALVSGC